MRVGISGVGIAVLSVTVNAMSWEIQTVQPEMTTLIITA
jgi:hypothetical protein